jgi:hypothetical protein
MNRTVFTSTATTFSNLKMFIAFFANAINHNFWSTWFKFLRARSRTRVSFSSYMAIGSSKLYATRCAFNSCMTAISNFSFRI